MESEETLSDSSQTQSDTSQAAKTDLSEPAGPPAQVESPAQPGPSVIPFAPDDGRYVTKEEYWAKWYENSYLDASYEWNNGRLEAKPPHNGPQLDLCNWFLDLLRRYIYTYPIADLINLETGFVLTMEDPAEPSGQREAVRKPDIGVILNSNPVPWGAVDQRHVGGVCDMVVEAISDATPAEVRRDTEEKRRDYALAGVKEYYILDPSGEHMRFYRLVAGGQYEEIQPDAGGIVASDVLPGLQFRLEDLKRQPGLKELALNDVYSGYVIPIWQIFVTKAEVAEKRADAAELRADAEVAARQVTEKLTDAEAAVRRATAAARQAEKQRTEEGTQRADAEVAARQAAENFADAEAALRRAETARRQAEELRADAAELRADAEAQRADMEERRADMAAAVRQAVEQVTDAAVAARQAAEQRAQEEAAARREAEEKLRAMEDEMARRGRQSS